MTSATDSSLPTPGLTAAAFRFEGGSVNLARREFELGGSLQRLEPKVFDVLWRLLLREGQVVSRDELLRAFWPDDGASDGALSRTMMKLRRALECAGQVQLRTVHRVGYRLDVQGLVREEQPTVSADWPVLRLVSAPWQDEASAVGTDPAQEPSLATDAAARRDRQAHDAAAALLRGPSDSAGQPGAHGARALSSTARARVLQGLAQGGPAGPWAAALARAVAEQGSPAAWLAVVHALSHERQVPLMAVAAHAHRHVAQGRINRLGVDAEVDRHLEEALRLARLAGEADLAIDTQVTQANLDLQRGRLARARACYEEVLSAPASADHPLQLARVLNNLGLLDARSGDLVGARSRFERALRHCRQQGLEHLMLCAASNLAMMQLDLACIADACETIDGVVELLPSVKPARLAADLALSGCRVYAEAGTPARMERLLPLLETWAAPGHAPVLVLALLARGLYATARGEHAAALAAVRQAVERARPMEERWRLVDWIGLWKRAAIRAGDLDSLAQARAAAQSPGLAQADNETLAGDECHAEAALCYQARQPVRAARLLDRAVAAYRPGALASRTRHDAAWICAEQGAPAKGRAWLRDLPHWREEHPLGWKLHARLLAAEGDAAAALRWQQQCVQRLGSCAHAFDHQLLAALRAAVAGAGRALPRAPMLPSLALPSL